MRGKIVSLLIVSVFLLSSATAAGPATTSQVTAAEATLTNEGLAGMNKLQGGDWEYRNEQHTWYFRESESMDYNFGSTSNSCSADTPVIYDPLDPQTPDTPVTFDLSTVSNEFELYAMSATVFIDPGNDADVEVRLMNGNTAIAGASVVFPFEALASNNPQPPISQPIALSGRSAYTANANFATPIIVPEAADLNVQIRAINKEITDYEPVRIGYGQCNDRSTLSLTGNFARFNVWTEDNLNRASTAFPTASAAPAEDRIVRVWAAHINALGKPARGDSPVRETQTTVPAVLDQSGISCSCLAGVRNIGTSRSLSLADGMELTQYQFQYPDDLEDKNGKEYDGRLTFELDGERFGSNWNLMRHISIGGAQVNLDLAQFEDRTKTVLVGQETTFLFTLKNGGFVVDDVIIDGASVNGWTVKAHVNSLNLAPGETRTFPVTITPPPGALSGEFQNFDINAISSRTGRTDSEAVTVVLTNIKSTGVDLLASQLDTVKMRAPDTKVVALTMKNLGNAADSFSVSTAGAPLGWKATISPSSTELGAKSQTGIIVTMKSPADAKQGDKFALVVTARSIADSAVKDTIVIPYEVFFVENFKLEVLTGAADGQFTSKITTKDDVKIAVTKTPMPGIHVMRDEGPDAYARPANSCGTLSLGCSVTTGSVWDADSDADIDYDQSTLYRLVLTNQGSRADTVRITPSWEFDNAWDSVDGNECEERDGGNTDGVPDGWRFRYWEAGLPEATALDPTVVSMGGVNVHDENPAGGLGARRLSADIKSFDLDPGETKYIWVELGWRPVARLDDGDNNSGDSLSQSQCQQRAVQSGAGSRQESTSDGNRYSDPAEDAVVRFRAESTRDLTKVQDLWIRAHVEINGGQTRHGSQLYSDQINNLMLGVDNADYSNPDRIGLANKFFVEGNQAARTAAFHMRGVNAGNEVDTIRFEVPQSDSMFTYRFDSASVVTDQMYPAMIDGHNVAPRAATCVLSGSDTLMDCTMGPFDEVKFTVLVEAKLDANGLPTVPIGLVKTVPVRAISLDSQRSTGGTLTTTVNLQATATGSYAFSISKPVLPNNGIHDVEVVKGKSIRVPFTIANIGTSADNYVVDLVEPATMPTGWDAIFGFNSPQFVAAGKDHHGFITIAAPAGATTGATETFRIRVASGDGTNVPERTLRIQAKVIAPTTGIDVVADPVEVIGFAGQNVDMTFKATRTSGAATSVDFEVDTASLPSGWTVAQFKKTKAYDALGKAEEKFTFVIPSDALGSSRVVVSMKGQDSSNNKFATQGIISLDSASTGVHLSSPEDFQAETIKANVVSGSKVDIPVRLQNLGGGIDQIALSTETLPSGWSVSFSEGAPSAASFQPFEARNIIVTVVAPQGVTPGGGIDIILKAASVSDATRTDTIVLAVKTGQSVLEVGTPISPTRFLSPLEETTFSYTVLNNGTVRDEVTFNAKLSAAYKDLIPMTFTPNSAILGPGESIAVTAKVTVPEGFLPDAVIPITLQAVSDGPLLNALGQSFVDVRVLDHRTLDIDNDGNPEYAIDRDRDASNGFEAFTDPKAGGKMSASMKMSDFLTPAAIDGYTVIVTDNNGTASSVFAWVFDLTGDGRIDHFIDQNSDNLADTFWDPYTGARATLSTTYDVTGDGVREYFVDVNGDKVLDVWYDIKTGKVGKLLKVDVDGDGVIDFVVDLNFNGQHDANEPVLFGKDGKITKITQAIDVNGDGKLDLVVDEDGDGIPDFFVPNGKSRGVKIVLEDVTGDGVEDWTYDANNDGKRDSYYDPVTGKTGSIDTGSQFIDGLVQYWYVPTLFALVTVLFVVLVVVTRR